MSASVMNACPLPRAAPPPAPPPSPPTTSGAPPERRRNPKGTDRGRVVLGHKDGYGDIPSSGRRVRGV